MRALVVGARGAVGSIIAEELRANGNEVTPAGRREAEGWVQIDLAAQDGIASLRRHAAAHDVIVNASGVEDPRIARALAGAVLVDISATASYLDRLARAAEHGAGIVLGAGLVPGLSTILLDSLNARPGDDLDLAVILGGGETHGAAAVSWTADLAGRPLHDPPETVSVLNFRESRRLPGPFGNRRHLRADFPDHLLLGVPGGFAVRSYLATDSRLATAALATVGRFPALRGIVRRAPHLGGAEWSLTARNRRDGATRIAQGVGQSRATGVLTARMAEAAGRCRPSVPVTATHLLSLEEAGALRGIRIT